MFLKFYIYSVFFSNLYANGIINYYMYKRLKREGYVFIDNNSMLEDLLELLSNSVKYLIPIYNIFDAAYNYLNRDTVYETYKDDCLLNGTIISEEDITKIKEITEEIDREDVKNNDIYKEPIKTKLLDIDTVAWKKMSEIEQKELLLELIDVKKEKKKENIIIKTLRKK